MRGIMRALVMIILGASFLVAACLACGCRVPGGG
jgi:hypothetical protein